MERNKMKAEVSFDTDVSLDGSNHVEGCYRVNNKNWKIFNFSHYYKGKIWNDAPYIISEVVWPSGVSGIDAVYEEKVKFTKEFILQEIKKIININDIIEVRGPDSLQMK